MHLQNERVIQWHQNLPLKLDIVKVVLLVENLFIEHLHCKVIALTIDLLLLYKEHLRKTALAKKTDQLDWTQISLVTEHCWCICATCLHYIVMQAYSFLGAFGVRTMNRGKWRSLWYGYRWLRWSCELWHIVAIRLIWWRYTRCA